jgi:ATP-binding cassette, subfamily B, bacterial
VARCYGDLLLYRRLLRQAAPYRLHIVGVFALSLLQAPLALLIPLPWKIAVDTVVGSEPLPGLLEALMPAAARSNGAVLVLAVGLVLAVALLNQLAAVGTWLLQTYTGEKLVLDFRARLFRHIQRLSLSYHDTQGTSDSTYRIQYDARSIEHILVTGSVSFVTECATLLGMIYVTAWIDWQLAAVALTVTPVLILITQAMRRRVRARWPEVKQHESSAMSVVQEVLAAVRVVRAFGQEDREHERFVRQSSRGVRGAMQLVFIQGGAGLLVGLTVAVGTAAVLAIGVNHVQSGLLTLGELVMVMVYLSRLYLPLETMSKKVADLQSALVGAERAFALLDEVPDVAERHSARPVGRAAGAVTFRDVSFAYDRERPVLNNISFDVGPGTRVGIAGTTGAGKTTLVSLLTRFYDPTDGRILLDGVDLRDYKLADLRNQFSIVLQEPVLFSTSIAENIAYARPGATEEQIAAAARAANAHEFIVGLPDGYETDVGERGMRLSGGERQRISLARAFLKDAPILILDEPTSSVDMATEAAIAEAMQRLMNGRTSFIISHRPSVLDGCDVLLVIRDGRLVKETRDGWRGPTNPLSLGTREVAYGGDTA